MVDVDTIASSDIEVWGHPVADGSKKAIAQVKVGDKVLATDTTTGKTGAGEVSNVITHDGPHTMVDVKLSDGSIIEATDGHPFYEAKTRSWVKAKALKLGAALVTAAGALVTVTGTTAHAETAQPYNLTVEGAHTYYAGDTPVLVHNSKCNLAGRAEEIHGALDGVAQGRRTTAALMTEEGILVAGGGVRDLSPAQRALLGEGEMAARGPGHAEVTAVQGARGAGLTPSEIATTTNICASCQRFLQQDGATITGPRSAKW